MGDFFLLYLTGMKHYILQLFIVVAYSTWAQIPYSFINMSEDYVKKQYEKESLNKDFIAKGYSISPSTVGDTLIYTINYSHKIIRKLVFNSSKSYCYYDQYLFSPDDTSYNGLLQFIFSDKSMKWKKVADNKYFSSWFWQTELIIGNTQEYASAIITIKATELPKEEYKTVYDADVLEKRQALLDSIHKVHSVPSNFKLVVTLDKPINIKEGLPGEILIDSTNTYFIISYDYNPSYLDVYAMKEWKLLKRLTIPKYTYLFGSYFYLKDNAVYVNYGGVLREKYTKIDLNEFTQTEVPCENTPRGCFYSTHEKLKSDFRNNGVAISTRGSYIIKYNSNKTEVYLKK